MLESNEASKCSSGVLLFRAKAGFDITDYIILKHENLQIHVSIFDVSECQGSQQWVRLALMLPRKRSHA